MKNKSLHPRVLIRQATVPKPLFDQPEYWLGRITALAKSQPWPPVAVDQVMHPEIVKKKCKAFEEIQKTVQEMHGHFGRQTAAVLRGMAGLYEPPK